MKRQEIIYKMSCIERELECAYNQLKTLNNSNTVELLVKDFDPRSRLLHKINSDYVKEMFKNHISELQMDFNELNNQLEDY